MSEKIILDHRYVARFTIKATTPLKVGTGKTGLLTDQLVATDVNGFPYIPGTAITGVLRNFFDKENEKEWVKKIFGYNEKEGDKSDGKGSRLIVSSAHMVGENGQVLEGLLNPNDYNSEFYHEFISLPQRDHVRITHKGVGDSKNSGKFDDQIVFKGTRFVFEIELQGTEDDEKDWNKLIEAIQQPSFRLGGGTRKGFGEIGVAQIESKSYNLTKNDELTAYLNKSVLLTTEKTFGDIETIEKKNKNKDYKLSLKPEDFFLFSSGASNSDTDMLPKKEKIINWTKDERIFKPNFSTEQILIPATSVKGAIAHRTAFYYNKRNEIYADKLVAGKTIDDYVGINNKAVKALFGFEANENNTDNDTDKNVKAGQRGHVIISDVYKESHQTKQLNHVAIDRFTGGAIDGALFNEEVVKIDKYELNITIDGKFKTDDDKIIEALEYALNDICTGMLPLGGGVMRGHGCFTGTIEPKLNLEENKND